MEGNLEKTLVKKCEVAKVMRFLKEINVYQTLPRSVPSIEGWQENVQIDIRKLLERD